MQAEMERMDKESDEAAEAVSAKEEEVARAAERRLAAVASEMADKDSQIGAQEAKVSATNLLETSGLDTIQ